MEEARNILCSVIQVGEHRLFYRNLRIAAVNGRFGKSRTVRISFNELWGQSLLVNIIINVPEFHLIKLETSSDQPNFKSV